ncbi:Hypothetical protein CINCED_3A025941 [Cinara cedri]|uniref:Cyclic nucleotide-binding domain-containing protein n=2 Tax=Cinara cedri TaxID=506608 RepID=A0A5E4M0Q8_9HEMI|nr:Hypothetical protein CINCED_3A025941 [Cinara cedri]
MKAYIFTPGDLICRKGEVAREMFIIADGILEVISSETGHVLTIMKAGDFFGEIGILNLDGFNKRTADVRSVGYSELFSLSREDVLAAMKDYPEAQDILQTLGRKRLMEARTANKIVADRIKSRANAEAAENCSGIVEKIRSDVKGLRNAFSKGRRGTRVLVEESMELQPLTSSGRKSENTSSKSILRRMPRVWSDELASGTDYSDEDPRPISPGIPILNKAKSDKEPRVIDSKKCLLSPPPSTSETARKESVNQEVIGAGLPLLQRLLILKQKTDQEVIQQSKPKKFDLEVPENAPKVKSNVKLKTPKKENTKVISLKQRLTDVHAKPRKPTTNTKFWSLLKKATVLTPKTKLQDTVKIDNEVPRGSLSLQPIFKTAVPEFSNTAVSSGCGNKFIVMCQKLDDQYKQGSLIAQNLSAHNNSLTNNHTEHNNIIKEQCDIRIVQRPKVLRLDGTKRCYDSINDLSPEYAGLSFVKKLKILNERQKLAELEERTFLRSASLDSAGCKNLDDPYSSQLTRSHSEAVALEVVLRNQKLRKPEPSSITPDECNETAERIRLKNILKKLSSNCIGNDRVNQLMNSQTIEGYAARHSKLTRNVTFNQRRTIVESSPDSCHSLFMFPDNLTPQCRNPDLGPLNSSGKTDVLESLQSDPNTKLSKRTNTTDTVQYLPDRPDIKQHCYDEIINGVKTVVEKCLDDLEGKYQNKIVELKSEINKRDYTISTLCEQFNQKLCDQPIDEKKLGALLDDYSKNIEEDDENPFIRNDSVDTILCPRISSFNSLSPFDADDSRRYDPNNSFSPALLSNKSWEDRSEEENMELRDLPKSIIPEPSWHQDETRIEMNCTDDEDEEEFPPRWENWEVEMLVGHTSHADLHMDPGLLSRRSLDENSMIKHRSIQGRRRCLSIDNVPFSNSILRNFGQYVRLGNSSSQSPSPDILPTISKSCFSLISQPEN